MSTPPVSKASLRRELRRRRGDAERDRTARADVAAERDARLHEVLRALAGPGEVVAAFVPSGGEIGGTTMPEVFLQADCRVLLPVLPDAPGPLRWAPFTSPAGLRPGRYGIPVPAIASFPPASLREASLVLVPALAVDRQGSRLGRGGGYYDRSLSSVSPGARIVAVVDTPEILDEIPVEPHDVRVHAAATPDGLVTFDGDFQGRDVAE